jgi:hypothetical protein
VQLFWNEFLGGGVIVVRACEAFDDQSPRSWLRLSGLSLWKRRGRAFTATAAPQWVIALTSSVVKNKVVIAP